jgi:hypothetical protein
MASKAISKFLEINSQNYSLNKEGKARLFSDEERDYFKAENEAVKKYQDTIKLKQQIQSETEAVILESQKEIKKRSGLLMQIGGGVQTYSNPRNWARGTVGLGKMVFGQTIETTVTGGKAIGEQNAATNLYTQSKDLADQAAKIVKTDRPQAESLLRQSQALIEEANKFAQGESTKKIMGADDKLTTKEIIGKSALTAIEVGSFAPIGSVAKGSFMLAKTVPPAVQGTKTVAVGNAITRALGLGDIYQVTKTGLQQGLKQEVKQTIVGQASWAAAQAPVTAGLIEMADDDGVNNYMGSLLTTGAGAFGLTLGFGYAGRVLGGAADEVVSNVQRQASKGKEVIPSTTPQKLLPLPQEAIQATTIVDGKVVNLPPSAYTQPALDPNVFEPKAQVIGTTVNEPLPNPYSKLGAFNPETDIPMIDITETIKPNNIDFNPDSVMSINATRKAVDDIALLNGNEVGGKKLKINTDDPKFKEIYNNKIKPQLYGNSMERAAIKRGITENPTAKEITTELKRLNSFYKGKQVYEVDSKVDADVKSSAATPQPAVEKVPVEDVEMEVQKIYSELENAGISITPEQVRYTPNIQVVNDKMSKGEQFTPEEFDKGMKEYVNSTGKTEVIDGVQEELINPMRKSTYVEKLKKENPDLNIESVQYEAAIVKDLEEKAINLIETNFDEAGRIAKNITKSSNPEQVKVAELYMEKLRELGKNDEYAQILHRFGKASSQAGQWNGILRPHKMGTPEYAIKQAQDARINKLKPEVEKQVAKVKQQMSSVKVDQTTLSDILDNITCR